jgi:hypothetical protein
VFENRVLRKLFGSKTDEVQGQWRRLHDEKLHGLCSLPDIIRLIKPKRRREPGNVAKGRCIQCFGGTREGKRPRHKWEDNIKMNVQKI